MKLCVVKLITQTSHRRPDDSSLTIVLINTSILRHSSSRLHFVGDSMVMESLLPKSDESLPPESGSTIHGEASHVVLSFVEGWK